MKDKNNKITIILILLILFIILFCIYISKEPQPKPQQYTAIQQKPTPHNTRISSFSKAKSILEKQVYSQLESKTFYCRCPYIEDTVNIQACHYKPHNKNKRASQKEWEHIVAMGIISHNIKSWTDGDPACVTSKGRHYKGRRCARKVSKEFRYLEADLHNLVPAIGDLNATRADFDMGEVSARRRELGEFGECTVQIDEINKIIEPPDPVKGDIARIYLYMNSAYPEYMVIKTKEQLDMFNRWSERDPVSQAEINKNNIVKKIQGNSNPFIARSPVQGQ